MRPSAYKVNVIGRKKCIAGGSGGLFQSLHFLRCYVRKLWRKNVSHSMSKTSSFLCNSLKDCEEIGSFPKICLRAMLKGSMKNVLLVPGYQDNRGLFHQAPDFLCVRLRCYLGMWNDLRMGIANKMACGNVHWDLGHIWHCTLRCLISLQLGKASSCSSE